MYRGNASRATGKSVLTEAAPFFTNWLTWAVVDPKDEWETWELWQRKQPPSHYDKSDIFQYYLSYRSDFQPPPSAASTGPNSLIYNYCFGDFAALLIDTSIKVGKEAAADVKQTSPSNRDHAILYFSLLLDVYDTCKGFSRKFRSDPTGISLLREIIHKNSLAPVHSHDFGIYSYDYGVLHAHTVAQYSLSTLLMLFVSNYLYHIGIQGNFPYIAPAVCQRAYIQYFFIYHHNPDPPRNIVTAPIDIPSVNSSDGGKIASWPLDTRAVSSCTVCARLHKG